MRKSQQQIGLKERGDEAAGRGIDVERDVGTAAVLQRLQRIGDRGDRLVAAVLRGAEHRDNADRVLVAERHRRLGGEMTALALHHRVARLDVPVPAELLPADLHVDAHDEIRLVARQACRLPPLTPAPLQREPCQHRGLARSCRRAADSRVRSGSVPETGEHVHAPALQLCRLRVLVLVDDVLVDGLVHEPLCLRLHPRRDERRQVEPGVAVEHQLVVDDLIREVREGAHPSGRWNFGHRLGFARPGVERVDVDGRVSVVVRAMMQRHRQSPVMS